MSDETYRMNREAIERDIMFYQGFLTSYIDNPERTEGYYATIAMIEPLQERLNKLNMDYYGTTVLY